MCFAPFLRLGEGKAMSMTYESVETEKSGDSPRKLIAEVHQQGWTWRWVGAVFGLAGGIACVLSGSAITAATWLTGAAGYGPVLHRFGAILLVLTIPLLIFGAHCLDLIEKQKDKERRLRFEDE